MDEKLTQHKKCQLIIEHFLSNNKFINWPNEGRIAKELLAGIPDHTFWLSLKTPKPICTLTYFKTPEGQLLIQLLYKNKEINLSAKSKEVILGDKLGEDKEAKEKKPKTLKDFLNAKTKKDTDAGS